MPSRAYKRGRAVSRVSFSLIAAVFLVLSTSFAVGVAHQLHQRSVVTAVAPGPADPKYLVVLVLDGAEPEYFNLASVPHLDALRHSGIEYDRAFAGILESETPSGHAALSSGSTPARDGLLGFNWIKNDNDAVRLFDPNVVRQGAMEQVMQRAGAPTIAALFKARYPRAKVVAVSGHKYYAADPLGGPAADYILYFAPSANNKRYVPTAIPGHVPPATVLDPKGLSSANTTLAVGEENRLAVKLALRSFRLVHQQVTLINLPEFDWPLGHVNGGDPKIAGVMMQRFDQDLASIEDAYRKAGVLNQTVFVLAADHGMAPLKYVVPDTVLDNAVTSAGAVSLETTYSTAGYIWLQNSSMAQAVADNVVAAKDSRVQSVYFKVATKHGDTYLRAGGLTISPAVDNANQYLLRSFLAGNAPDVVAFLTEDAAFEVKSAEGWKANHGGAAWQSQRIPLIIAGPGVAQGKVSHSPARLEDIAPTALALFGIPATGMEGTTLADALTNPSSRQVAAQQTLNRTLNPVVDALQAQSQADLSSYSTR